MFNGHHPVLRSFFLIAVGLMFILLGSHAPWTARLNPQPLHTFIMDLPRHPLWSPPPTPTLEHFEDVFASERFSASAAIHVSVDWFKLFFEILVGLWLMMICIAFVYLVVADRRPDPVLQISCGIAAASTIGVVASVVLWVILGGWGPPCMEYLLPAGFILGSFVGWRWHQADLTGKPDSPMDL